MELYMKQLLNDILVGLSSNTRLQNYLERNVNFSQFLMGIGAGSGVDSSGEKVLVQKLRQIHIKTKQPLPIHGHIFKTFGIFSKKMEYLVFLE